MPAILIRLQSRVSKQLYLQALRIPGGFLSPTTPRLCICAPKSPAGMGSPRPRWNPSRSGVAAPSANSEPSSPCAGAVAAGAPPPKKTGWRLLGGGGVLGYVRQGRLSQRPVAAAGAAEVARLGRVVVAEVGVVRRAPRALRLTTVAAVVVRLGGCLAVNWPAAAPATWVGAYWCIGACSHHLPCHCCASFNLVCRVCCSCLWIYFGQNIGCGIYRRARSAYWDGGDTG
jgi:hypothetical protein